MKEHTTITLESNQKFTFSIKNDWLIVRSHEELERLRVEEKKAKKARFFQSYGKSSIAKKSESETHIRDTHNIYHCEREIQEYFLQPNEQIQIEPPATD